MRQVEHRSKSIHALLAGFAGPAALLAGEDIDAVGLTVVSSGSTDAVTASSATDSMGSRITLQGRVLCL
jgi:hypothetical protein